MKKISAAVLENTQAYITKNGNDLVKAMHPHVFEYENTANVFKALAAYQNPDGGFGHGLEGDFMLPDSSPMATSVAFQIFTILDTSSGHPMVQQAVQYLLESFDPGDKKWHSVPKSVNEYPHAPWWHYHEDTAGSGLEPYWGNPTAELVGYLIRYHDLVPAPFLAARRADALQYLKNHPDEMEMHELYCFLRFARELPAAEFKDIQAKLTRLVGSAVETDPEKWRGYAAQPLDFIYSPDDFLYPHFEESVQANLDFWIDTITPEGVWPPAWSWGTFPEDWEKAKKFITCRMATHRLKVLRDFGRFEL